MLYSLNQLSFSRLACDTFKRYVGREIDNASIDLQTDWPKCRRRSQRERERERERERDDWMKVGGCRERDGALVVMEKDGRAKSLIIALQGSESVQRKKWQRCNEANHAEPDQ